MLTITIPDMELFDEKTSEFINIKEQVLSLEHSLVSISKWEIKWKKPFISRIEKTEEETRDYIRCMTITQNVNPDIFKFMPISIVNQVTEYINDSATATTISTFGKSNKPVGNKPITNEVVYSWMVNLGIPFECQKWHFNRLMTLIRLCNMQNSPSKKQSAKEILSSNAALNAARRKSLGTKG